MSDRRPHSLQVSRTAGLMAKNASIVPPATTHSKSQKAGWDFRQSLMIASRHIIIN